MENSSPAHTDPRQASRHALRQRLIATREALPAPTRAKLEAALLNHARTLLAELHAGSASQLSTLGFCWPFRGEPDLREIVTEWLQADARRRGALPVVSGRDAPLLFRRWTPTSAMFIDRYGIATPSEGETLHPDLLLVPLNGFDARGYRLGYGGGYFDRTLASLHPAPLTIGVGFELGRVARLDEEGHDVPMDWIVTEAGAFEARPEAGVGRTT